jgi:hypothetical protein
MPAEEHLQYVPEPSGVDARVVSGAALGALALLAGSIAVFYTIYNYSVPIKTVPLPEQFARPQVVTSEAETAELHRLHNEQSARLEAWGWSNDQRTLVKIPIERAMQLLEQKGGEAYAPLLPPQPTLGSPTAAAQNAVTPNAGANSPSSQRKPP